MTYATFVFFNIAGAVALGRDLRRRRLRPGQRADREGELLAGGAGHRVCLGPSSRVRAAEVEKEPSPQIPKPQSRATGP